MKKEVQSLLQEAESAVEDGFYFEAHRLLDEIEAIDPDNQQVQEIRWQLPDDQDVALLQVSDPHQSVWAERKNEIQLLIDHHRISDARWVLRQLFEALDPAEHSEASSLESLVQSAEIRDQRLRTAVEEALKKLEANHLEEALKRLETLKAQEPRHPEVIKLQSRIEDYSTVLKTSVEHLNKKFESLVEEAGALGNKGLFTQARGRLDEASEINPSSEILFKATQRLRAVEAEALGWFSQAMLKLDQDDLEGARKARSELAVLAPRYPDREILDSRIQEAGEARRRQAELDLKSELTPLLVKGDLATASALLDAAGEPESGQIRNMRQSVHRAREEAQQARKDAWRLLESGRLDRAKQALALAKTKDSSSPENRRLESAFAFHSDLNQSIEVPIGQRDPIELGPPIAPERPTPSPPELKKDSDRPSVAERSVAERSVAERSVAERSVAERSVAGRSVAGRSSHRRGRLKRRASFLPSGRKVAVGILLMVGLGSAIVLSIDYRSKTPPQLKRIEIPNVGNLSFGCRSGDALCAEDEKPSQPMPDVPGFQLSAAEVSRADYARCAKAGKCKPLEMMSATPEDLPMSHVSWFEAYDFCAWLDGRLPTEVEWELAARVASAEPLSTNTSAIPALPPGANHGATICCGEDSSDGWLQAAPVQEVGANEIGLLGMAGNVAEWTASEYTAALKPVVKELRPEQEVNFVAVRGGSWIHPPAMLRPTARQAMSPDIRSGAIGFRCAWPRNP